LDVGQIVAKPSGEPFNHIGNHFSARFEGNKLCCIIYLCKAALKLNNSNEIVLFL